MRFLPLTLSEWNAQARALSLELEGLEAPADHTEAALVLLGARELERRGSHEGAAMRFAAAREWASDVITERCEREAMAAPDFDGGEERAR